MTKISRASLRSYTTTHLTYRPPDEARRLLHEHANAIILRAGKALAEILPESEASVAALDALGIARMRCNQAIAHDECDVDEAKARLAKAVPHRGIAEVFQAAAKAMGETIEATGKAIGKLAIVSGDPKLLRSLGLKGQQVADSQSIRSEDPERVFDGMAERMKANAAKMKRVSLRDLDYRAADKATRVAVTTPVTNSTDTFDVVAVDERECARVEHLAISAERLVEWARDNLARAEDVERVREWSDRDAPSLLIDRATFTNDHSGRVTVARNLGGALPEPTDVADTNTAIASVIERLDTLADRLEGLVSVDAEFEQAPVAERIAEAFTAPLRRLASLDGAKASDEQPEGFDRHEALSELAGYGFENGTLLKCSDAELSHLVGQWRRFKAANVIMAEELDRHGAVQAGHLESMREQHKEVVALRSALAKSDADAEHLRSLLAEVGSLLLGPAGTPTEANVLGEAKALRGMVDGDHRLSAAFGQAGRLAEVKAKALGMLKQESADVDAEVKKLEGLLLGLDTGNPRTREDRVIALVEEAKLIRHLVAGMGCPSKLSDIIAGRAERASASNKDAFERGRAEGQADVAARLRKLLDPSDERNANLDGLIVMVGDLLGDVEKMRSAAKGAAIQAADAAAEARKTAKDQMHEAMQAAKEEKWKAGHANGMEWAWISLRKAIDPTQKATWTFDQMLGIVGDWRERVDRVQPMIDETAGRPAMVTCPPEGLMVLRSWNGVRLVSEDGSGSVYLCARDGGWEWHDGDEKWRPLSAEANDEQAFADGRKQGIADVREAINAIEVNGTMAGIDQIVPRREDVIRLIDALGGSPPNDGDIIHDEARALSSQSVNVMRSVSALLRSTRQIGKKVVERRALDDARRNQWIVDNKLWEPQEATPVSGSRLRVPNVAAFAEAAPGVPVSVGNGVQVMVGDIATGIVAVDEDDDSTGGEVTITHHVKWTSDGPVTIRRVIE